MACESVSPLFQTKNFSQMLQFTGDSQTQCIIGIKKKN